MLVYQRVKLMSVFGVPFAEPLICAGKGPAVRWNLSSASGKHLLPGQPAGPCPYPPGRQRVRWCQMVHISLVFHWIGLGQICRTRFWCFRLFPSITWVSRWYQPLAGSRHLVEWWHGRLPHQWGGNSPQCHPWITLAWTSGSCPNIEGGLLDQHMINHEGLGRAGSNHWGFGWKQYPLVI